MHATSSPHLILRPLTTALLLVTALAAPLAANAQSAPAAAGQSQDASGAKVHKLQAIGATATQQSQIQAILKQAHADVQQQRRSSGDLHRQLAQVLAAPTVDAAAAETLRQRIVAQRDSTSQRMLQARLQVAAVLTPDQRQRLLALNEQQGSRWHHRHASSAPA